MPLQPGRQLLHYRLIEQIGEGGMGVVWKAVDTTLDREVAIKFLPEALAGDAERLDRFEREAKLVASLNHANIAVVYGLHEVSPEDAATDAAHPLRFLAMELVDGEDLSRRLESGALPPEDALRVGLRIAGALEAAHEKGVIHRDLKPANVRMSTRGEIKVLDFGLAKELGTAGTTGQAADDATRTSTPTGIGMVLGTAGYMSPEQARGNPVDTRTDIWAFGCVLYEMLAGQSAFGGETMTDKLAAVLKDDPDWSELPAATPAPVRALVRHCLAKEADERLGDIATARRALEAALGTVSSAAPSPTVDSATAIASAVATAAATAAESATEPATTVVISMPGRWITAAAVVIALAAAGWWISQRGSGDDTDAGTGNAAATESAAGPPTELPTQTPDRRSVAVLPFENITADADGAVFTTGIHDDILTQLAKIRDLKTISRTSVLEYRNTAKSIPQIGTELGVAAIVEGGVQRAGDLVRINIKLIDAVTEANLWAESYDRQLTTENIFAIQSEIASAIASVLEAKLSPGERRSLATVPTASLEAYDLYLRGVEYNNRAGNLIVDQLEAERALLRAIEIDPDFALAHARLAGVYTDLYWVGGEPTERRLSQALRSATRAVELAPDRGEARLALGYVFYVSRDYDRALEQYAIAERALPGDAVVWSSKAALTRRLGRWEESLPGWARALELDPRDANAWFDTGLSYTYLERYDEAERHYARALEIAPGYTEVQVLLAVLRCNRNPTVESCRREFVALDPEAVWQYRQTGFAWRLGLQARAYDETLDMLAAAGEWVSYQEYDYPRDLMVGITLQLAGDEAGAAPAFRSAAGLLEAKLAERPDYAPHRGALGLAYAGLGRREDAVREGLRAVELLPVERDALVGSWQLADLGFVYVAVGEFEAAVDVFERFLSRRSMFSAGALGLDPRLEPLLASERFRGLVGG